MIAKIFGGKSNNFLECENTWLINIHTTKKGIFYYHIKKYLNINMSKKGIALKGQ